MGHAVWGGHVGVGWVIEGWVGHVGVGSGGSCRDWVGHAGGGSFRGGVTWSCRVGGHAGVGVVMSGWGVLCRVGWVMQG